MTFSGLQVNNLNQGDLLSFFFFVDKRLIMRNENDFVLNNVISGIRLS